MRTGLTAIGLIIGYFVVSILLTGIALAVGANCLSNQQFSCTAQAVSVGKGAFYPYHLFNQLLQLQLLDEIDTVLNLLAESPAFFQSVQTLLNSYSQQIPLKDFEQVSRVSNTVQRLSPQFEQLLTKSLLMDEFCSACQQLRQSWIEISPLIRFSILLLDDISLELEAKGKYTVLVLFQNNMELRPTGGFMGSYGVLTLEVGGPIKFTIEDIYVPDGQLVDHVEPPMPIQEAFLQGFWKLRDANWDPDYQGSVESVEWFFKTAIDQEFDAVISVPFLSFQRVLEVIGPVYVPEAGKEVSAQTVYPLLQRVNSEEFFPGSTEKKDVLAGFYRQLSIRLSSVSLDTVLKVLSVIVQELGSKNILIQADDPLVSEFVSRLNWSGQLGWLPCSQTDCMGDYFSIFDANLGVNKANCCVDRQVNITVSQSQSDLLTSNINIAYFAHSGEGEHEQITGPYKAYVRIYLPPDSTVNSLSINGVSYAQAVQELKLQGLFSDITVESYALDTVNGLLELGFWVYVPLEQATMVELFTARPIAMASLYQLHLQKQPGVLDRYNHFRVNLFGDSSFDNTLTRDTSLIHRLEN